MIGTLMYAGLAVLCSVATAAAAPRASAAGQTAVPDNPVFNNQVADSQAAAQPPPHGDTAWRGMNKDLFVSTHDPQLEMRIAPELRYIGKLEFDLKDSAHVERHHFVTVKDGLITRMLVLQFEEMLPTNDDIYRWTVRKPQTLGNQVYQFSTFVFSVPKAVQSHPQQEVGRTQAFLASKNLRLADELAVASFARVIGEDRRHEFIILYNEPLRAASHGTRDAAGGDESASTPFENLSATLTERALASFTISELPPAPAP